MNLVYLLYLVILSNYVTAQWTLNLIDIKTFPLARCLDGTPGGYYISPGTGDDAANILHILLIGPKFSLIIAMEQVMHLTL